MSGGIEFNSDNFNAKQIFEKLDAADGKSDGKIKKTIWNTFAEAAGGNKIKNYIEQENGIKAIGRYLTNASDETFDKVGDYLEKIEDPDSQSSSILEEGNNNAPEGKICVGGYKGKDGKYHYWYVDKEIWEKRQAEKDAVLEGYSDNESIRKIVSKTVYDKTPISTTDEERKEALNYEAESGRTYAEARNIVTEIETEVVKRINHSKTEGSISNLDLIKVTISDLKLAIERGKWFLENGSGTSTEINNVKQALPKWEKELAQAEAARERELLKNMTPQEREDYISAKKDMNEIQNIYPDVETCLSDLRKIYNKTK